MNDWKFVSFVSPCEIFFYFNQFKCPLSLGACVVVVVFVDDVVGVAAVDAVVVVSLYCMCM